MSVSRARPPSRELALADLVAAHQADLWRYLRFLGCEPALADDLVQETFVAVWRRPFEPRGPRATAAYLRTVARNLFLMAVRKRRARPAFQELREADEVFAARTGDDGGAAYRDALEACLETLAAKARRALELFYGGARRRDEVADALGLARGAVTVDGGKTVATARGDVVVRGRARVSLDGHLYVAVARGEARVDGRVVAAGERFTTEPPSLAPAVRARIDELTAQLRWTVEGRDLSDPVVLERLKQQDQFAAQLGAILGDTPGAWDYARAELRRLPEDREARLHFLALLAGDPASHDVLAAELRRAPRALSTDLVLLLAEGGDATARAELEGRVAAGGFDAVLPAVWFALRGDPRGRDVLRWFAGSRNTATHPERYFAVAAALARLGEDTHWSRARGFARRRTERHLENGFLGTARRTVVAFARFDGVRAAGTVPLDRFDERLRTLAVRALPELPDAAAIRARLAELTGG